MQPTYGITHDRLTKYYQDLRDIGVGKVETTSSTRAVLWLSGLHYSFSYCKASLSGSESETHLAPVHWLDDGLDDTASVVLKRLIRVARSRSWASALAIQKERGPINAEWYRVSFAWILSDELLTGSGHKWLAKNEENQGWLRLCVATGIRSFCSPEALDFVRPMMQKPFARLIPEMDDERNMQVKSCVKSLVRDHRVDLQEL